MIKLNESPECEAAFGDFLKYFYTHPAPANFPCDKNVFAVHMLADKYAMKWLKADAEKVMKEVVRKECPLSLLVRLPYIEACVPNLLPLCYDVMHL